MEEELWDQAGRVPDQGCEESGLQDVAGGETWDQEDFVEEGANEQSGQSPTVEDKDVAPTTYQESVHAEIKYEETMTWGKPEMGEVNETYVKKERLDAIYQKPKTMWSIGGGLESSTMRKLNIGELLTTNVGFGQSLKRMVREAWGAAVPGQRQSLRSPIGKIRFTQTSSEYCSSTAECIRRCQELQKYYMDLGFPDIPYNFLIGGDGVLYHGRGWNKQADRSPGFLKLKRNCLDVAYIGDFVGETKIPYEMLAVAADFIKYGLKVARITPFFQAFTYLTDDRRS